MRIAFQKFLILIACLFSVSIAYANSIFNIVPSITQTVIRSDAEKFVTYTVTNTTAKNINRITVDPSFQSNGNHAQIALQNNTCASANLTPGASCTFKLLIQGAGQPTNFIISPRVCGFNNAICSQPILANRLNVKVVLITHVANAYVGLSSGPNINNIQAILTSNNTLGQRLAGFDFTGFFAIGTTTAGDKLYVANQGNNRIIVVKTLPILSILTSISVASTPVAAAVLPNDTKVYAISFDSSLVTVINATTNTIITTIPVGGGPQGVVTSPDNARVYVTNLVDSTLSVINANTDTLITTVSIPTLNFPQSIAINPDGQILYITNFAGNTVAVVNARTLQLIKSIPVGTGPAGVSVSPDGLRVFVANNGSGNVSVIDATTNLVIATIPVGNNPAGTAVTPDGRKVYVTLQNENFVAVIDTSNYSNIVNVNVNGGQSSIGTFIG